jgi:hypothetical protein
MQQLALVMGLRRQLLQQAAEVFLPFFRLENFQMQPFILAGYRH